MLAGKLVVDLVVKTAAKLVVLLVVAMVEMLAVKSVADSAVMTADW